MTEHHQLLTGHPLSLMQGTLACLTVLALFALLALVLAAMHRHEAGPGASRTPELLVSCHPRHGTQRRTVTAHTPTPTHPFSCLRWAAAACVWACAGPSG